MGHLITGNYRQGKYYRTLFIASSQNLQKCQLFSSVSNDFKWGYRRFPRNVAKRFHNLQKVDSAISYGTFCGIDLQPKWYIRWRPSLTPLESAANYGTLPLFSKYEPPQSDDNWNEGISNAHVWLEYNQSLGVFVVSHKMFLVSLQLHIWRHHSA